MNVDWWKTSGLAGGAGAGFWLGGPIGAAVGAAAGWLLGGAVEPKKLAAVVPPPKPSPHSPPIPNGPPQPSVPVQPAIPPAPLVTQQTAGVAMNAALSAQGYKKADMPIYMAFQRTAGLKMDGYPGTNTMGKLSTVLLSAGVPMAPVRVYPWFATGGYDGINAPTVQEWIGDPNWSGPPPTVAGANLVSNVDAAHRPVASQVIGATPLPPGAVLSTVHDVQRALNQIGIANPKLVADGNMGPKTAAAVTAFQKTVPNLKVDGNPGPDTKAALQVALAGNIPVMG